MDGKSLDIKLQKLRQLRQILPEAFTENLEALKVLQKAYYGRIKMIYIDPSYNTGNDSFIYPDKFSESRDAYLTRVGDKDEGGYLTPRACSAKTAKTAATTTRTGFR